jgi:hypothetical protein
MKWRQTEASETRLCGGVLLYSRLSVAVLKVECTTSLMRNPCYCVVAVRTVQHTTSIFVLCVKSPASRTMNMIAYSDAVRRVHYVLPIRN